MVPIWGIGCYGFLKSRAKTRNFYRSSSRGCENCGKLGMFFSRREKKAVIFPDSPGESFVENLDNLRFQQEPGKTYC